MKSDNIGLEDDLNDYPKIKNIFIDINVVNFERPSYFTSKRELQKIYRITFNEFNQIDNLISKLNKLDNVVYAEKEPIYKTTYIPDDTYHYGTNKWYHSQVNSEQAWDISLGSESVKIAIVDNAIATEHLDLNVFKKRDIADNDDILLLQEPIMKSILVSWNYAGLATAEINNSTGIASIGGNVQLIAVKATGDSQDPGFTIMGMQGFRYENGANVVSMSYGSQNSLMQCKSL